VKENLELTLLEEVKVNLEKGRSVRVGETILRKENLKDVEALLMLLKEEEL